MNNSKPNLLEVLMMPDYRQDNPYQSLLTEALKLQQVKVNFPRGYRRVLPIFRAVKSQPCDVLHLHWLSPYIKGKNARNKLFYSLKFLIDILLVRLSGVKVVWTVHNHISHNCQFPKTELWVRKILAKLVNQIIVHNNSTADYLIKDWQVNLSKIELIPHGHYRDAYRKAIAKIDARKQLELPLTEKIYLNLGMLRPYKGLENLIEVWHSKLNIISNATLLIAGKPLNKSYGKNLKKLTQKTPNIILHLEFVADEKIHLYYSAADLVILPFENILTSGSLILAMSYGKPIIAPKLGGIAETLGKADSLLYDSQNSKGLPDALEKSIHTDIRKLSQQVIESCNYLDWSLLGNKTQKIYQQKSNSKALKIKKIIENKV